MKAKETEIHRNHGNPVSNETKAVTSPTNHAFTEPWKLDNHGNADVAKIAADTKGNT
jgi:hypothetical protein